jgi:hypothetical protein
MKMLLRQFKKYPTYCSQAGTSESQVLVHALFVGIPMSKAIERLESITIQELRS